MTEAWLSNMRIFEERTDGPKQWGDVPDDEDNDDKSDKGSVIIETKDDGELRRVPVPQGVTPGPFVICPGVNWLLVIGTALGKDEDDV